MYAHHHTNKHTLTYHGAIRAGATGHQGGAESPTNRCPSVNYTSGVFRCSCCGAPLFYARNKYDAMTGWPAFHGLPAKDKKTNTSNVCTPGGTEVVCARCGSHLGDYFDDQDHFCIDGVCLMPPGSDSVCPPGPGDAPSSELAWGAFKKLVNKVGAKNTKKYINSIKKHAGHDHHDHNHDHDDHHHHWRFC